jgi:spermidine synthase
VPEIAVFVSGVVSMGIEILVGRVVAPDFGSSIFVWGSIIGVSLTALSIGYHYGGKRAGERATPRKIVRLLIYTAIYVGGLVWVGDSLVAAAATIPLPERFASLPAVVAYLAVPTYILGFFSPYAAELLHAETVGKASGHVYAVGTIGSIVGAFGTTFLLIPAFTTTSIELFFALLLLGTAFGITLATTSGGDRQKAVTVDCAVSMLTVALAAPGAVEVLSEDDALPGETVYETQTQYQKLAITDHRGVRTMYLNGQPQSAMDLSDPYRHVFDYSRYMHLPFLFAGDPDQIDRVLFIGGGGFTGPKHFVQEYDVTVDVAEVDPAVVHASKRYFDVDESENLTIHTTGGRQYLQETETEYDLVVVDAFKKDQVPFQLTTSQFMELARSRLSDDGILYMNLISAPEGSASQFYRAEYRTMDAVFPNVYSFPTAGQASYVQNVEVVATKKESVVTQDQLAVRNRNREVGIDLSSEIESYRATEETADVPVLRDDYAPVDEMLNEMAGRQYVVDGAPGMNGTGAGPNQTARTNGTTSGANETAGA